MVSAVPTGLGKAIKVFDHMRVAIRYVSRFPYSSRSQYGCRAAWCVA
jgi:hypothetical protein